MIGLGRNINDSMPSHVASEILDILNGIQDPVVTILGVTYKPNVDDTRESPVLHLIDILKQQKINVRAFDPYVAPQNCKIEISDSLKRRQRFAGAWRPSR